MKKFLYHHWDKIVLSFFCLFVLISHFFYISLSRQYPQWDEHHYMSLGVQFFDMFRSLQGNIFQQILKISDYRQPLYSLILSIPFLLFGLSSSYKIALAVNGFLYIGTIIGVYVLMRGFSGKLISLLGSLVFSSLGFPLFYLHFTYSETATTFFVIYTILFLVKSRGFSKWNYTVLASIFFICAALTRWVAPIFVAGPMLLTYIEAIKKKNIIPLLVFSFIAFGGSIILYYGPNMKPFLAYTERNRVNASDWVTEYRSAEFAKPFSVRSIMYYINIMSENTVFFFVPFAIGVLCSLFRFKKYGNILLGWFVPYAFFTFLAVWKDDRFIVPLYPFFAMSTVLPIEFLKKKKVFFYVTSSLIVIISVISFFGASWGIGPMGKRGLFDVVLPAFIKHPRRIYLTPMVWPPNKEFANAKAIVDVIRKNKKMSEKAQVLSLFSFEPVDNALQSILLYEDRTTMDMVKIDETLKSEEMQESLLKADFILVKSGNTNKRNDVFYEMNNTDIPLFRKIEDIVIPIDDSTVTVFMRVKSS